MKTKLKPDFTKYSLALVENDKIVYSSRKSGLRPLWDCLKKYRQAGKEFILFDKVIGLAAAKLVVYAKIIAGIKTLLVSTPAKEFLDENGIPIKTRKTVPNILTKKMKAVCPGEIIALNTDNPKSFHTKIRAMLDKN